MVLVEEVAAVFKFLVRQIFEVVLCLSNDSNVKLRKNGWNNERGQVASTVMTGGSAECDLFYAMSTTPTPEMGC